jgi:hypothetical protein
MGSRLTLLVLIASAIPGLSAAQQVVKYRSAIVALADDAELRKSFEDALAAIAREHDYDAITSYDIEPKVANVDGKRFLRTLAARDVQAVLMLRPAAIGPGSSLESVRGQVPQQVYRNIQDFAKRVSPSAGDDLIAVVHMAIYTIDNRNSQLISAGAVWLDEPVESQAEGILRLQNLIVANVDAARPAIRRRLGLPPLP